MVSETCALRLIFCRCNSMSSSSRRRAPSFPLSDWEPTVIVGHMNCGGAQVALVVREGGNDGDGDDACNGNMAVAAAVCFVCSLVPFTATNCNVIATHNTDNFAIIFRKLSDNLLIICF